jgi:hypothetical protein
MKNIEDLNVSTIQVVHTKVFFIFAEYLSSNLKSCFFMENCYREKKGSNTNLAKLIT